MAPELVLRIWHDSNMFSAHGSFSGCHVDSPKSQLGGAQGSRTLDPYSGMKLNSRRRLGKDALPFAAKVAERIAREVDEVLDHWR
jgi:hypothetical protein